ncbi:MULTISPECIES: hypothetical protein [Glycomyces]|uniref:Uncharacterized protein n=2 Tax=Glycomyces TaxID=58113 RepID=A0A9X3T7X4_9ACTN|nr:hypothetical protein [Glycomyces lechevalierae]MDA1384673.1 hypothetical protein [Glycomyces lechevalierae]MDR7337874.1 hypothetical protein [Glycomyces lechevalierae]
MPHRRPATLVAAAAALLLCTTATASVAASTGATADFVDLVLAEGGSRCEADRVQVGAAPPATVAIDADKVDFDCRGDTSFKFGGDAAFAFDDAKGTATAEDVRIAARKFGVTCTYEASRVTLERDGATREYRGGPIGAKKVGGSFLCPGSVNLDSAEVVFHQ